MRRRYGIRPQRRTSNMWRTCSDRLPASRRTEPKLIMSYRIANKLVDVTTSAPTAAPTRTRGNTATYNIPPASKPTNTPSFRAPSSHGRNAHKSLLAKNSTHLEDICTQCLRKYIFMFYYPPSPRNTTHYLRPTKLDNTLVTYIRGYYIVLSYNNNKN